ncbi:hypothetical protein D3C76_1444410 [compost metagenome]
MPLVAKSRGHDGLRSRVQVRGFVNDDAVFAAHFGDEPFDPDLPWRRIGRELADAQPDLLRSGEADKPGFRVRSQVIADLGAAARNEVQHPGR